MDAVVLSDIHLGSDTCRVKELSAFLLEVRSWNPKWLIINGDLFDSIDFRRLKKSHWRILSDIRRLSDKMEVIWIEGNHDVACDVISHLIGAQVAKEWVLTSGERRILFVHGHEYDSFITDHPLITTVADWIYLLLQWVDRSCYFAKLAKTSSKTFLRCAQIVETGAVKLAKKMGCHAVVCGHTHHAYQSAGQIEYVNDGCWTEHPMTYLTIDNGVITLKQLE